MCWFLQLICRWLCHLYRCLGRVAQVHWSMSGLKLICSMGLVGVGDARVIGRIPYPGPQGCPSSERSASCRDRQILSTHVPKVPVLGIGWKIGRPRCVGTVLFWRQRYGIVPMLPKNCGVVVQVVTKGGLGVTDTLGSGGGLDCGVLLGPLGEATLSKTSLVGVACWKGAMLACWAGVLCTDAGNGGGDHVVALGASLSSSFSRT